MSKYKHIFFDFDNTLWDFTYNSKESLKEIFDKYNFAQDFENFDNFYQQYEKNNEELWALYREGNISKDSLTARRFLFASEKRRHNELSSLQINSDYLSFTTQKTKVIEHAIHLLKYLQDKYIINILTDGFFEVQMVKLRTSKLSSFISNIITAEEVGHLKPNKELFEFAMDACDAKPEESIMVGDNYSTDIVGAHYAGMDQIFFNREKKANFEVIPTFTVTTLKEIMNIL